MVEPPFSSSLPADECKGLEEPVRLRAAVDYQTVAHTAFAALYQELRALLPGAQIEHIGASAIPGAVSKGDLDTCVLVAAHAHAQAVATLQAAGYAIKADTLRTPALCMLASPRTDLDVALQVVARGSEFEFFLHFRDALRANPHLVQQYNELKQRFAPCGMERYREEKSRFIHDVLKAASD